MLGDNTKGYTWMDTPRTIETGRPSGSFCGHIRLWLHHLRSMLHLTPEVHRPVLIISCADMHWIVPVELFTRL
jgi:hypothetical protein